VNAHVMPAPLIDNVNNDGIVDIFDIGIANAHWGES